MKTKFLFGLMALLLLMGSCKGKKKKQDNNGTDKPTVEIVNNGSADPKLLNNVKNLFAEKDTFSTVEIGFNLKLESPERNLSASGQLRIANDSVIWLYVKALGFEVARAKFTKDSVAAVVKLKNSYFKGDYSAMKRYIPVAVDFSVLQSIFMNEIFLFPENDVKNLSYFSFFDDDNSLRVTSFDNANYAKKFGFNYLFNVAKSNSRINTAVVEMPQNHKQVKIEYSDYNNVVGHLMPYELKISMDESVVTFTTNKITFGKNLKYPLTIPSNYKPFNF
ncbi:MAG: DUF4292 domain-containing protein [Bacteroidales bacterium]|nr:DUF4292 domain-containing protein [Bacteroidales bacterium]